MGSVVGLLIGVAGALVVWLGLRRDAGALKIAGVALLVGAIGVQVLAYRAPGGGNPHAVNTTPIRSASPTASPSPSPSPSASPSRSTTPRPSPSPSPSPSRVPTTTPPSHTTTPPHTTPPHTTAPPPTISFCPPPCG